MWHEDTRYEDPFPVGDESASDVKNDWLTVKRTD